MKGYVLFFVLVICNVLTMIAQSISGRVVDEYDAPIAYVSVVLRCCSDTTKIYGGISNDKGEFNVKLPNATYHLSCRFIGYRIEEQDVLINGDMQIGKIILKEDIYQLKGVEVIANRVTRKSDRFEINMMNNPLSQGKNVRQILAFLPGVSTNNGISINGRSGTLIYIDDRKIRNEDELSYLRAEDIKSIEIIPIVGSEYSAGVEGGILKIYLRKQEQGISGTFINYLKMTDRGFKSEAPGVILNYRYKKIGINNTTIFGGGRFYPNDEERKTLHSDNNYLLEKSLLKRSSLQLNENFTFRYDINDDQNLAFSLNVNLEQDSLHRHSESIFYTKEVYRVDKMVGIGKNKVNDLNAILLYNLNLGNSKHRLTLEMDYLNVHDNGNNVNDYLMQDVNEGNIAYIQTYNNKSKVNVFTVKPYINFNFKKRSNLKIGLTTSFVNNKNDIENSGLSEDYILKGSDHAFFTDFKSYLSDRTHVSVGVRYQIDLLNYNKVDCSEADFSKGYYGLFPSFNFQYLLNKAKGKGMILGYRHYQSLPSFGYYSTVKEIYSGNYYSVGNPNLEPEKFHLAEITYVHNKVFNLIYSSKFGKNLIQVMSFTDNDNSSLTYTQPVNIGRSQLHSLKTEVSGYLFPYWYCKISFSGNYEDRCYAEKHFSQWFGQLSLDNNFQFRNNWSVAISTNISTKRRYGDYSFSSGHATDIIINKSCLKDKMDIGIGSSNLFFKRRYITTEQLNGNRIISIGSEPIRDYYLSISYRFKRGKEIKSVKSLRGNKLDLNKATLR